MSTTKSDDELALQAARQVFDHLSAARLHEGHVRRLHTRNKNKPVYQQFMKELMLEGWLKDFTERPQLKRG